MKSDDMILNFGSGPGYLESTYPNYDIVPYDIDPQYGTILNWEGHDFNKVLMADTVEHIPLKDIIEILQIMAKKNVVLVTVCPKDNFLSKLIRVICGRTPRPLDHILDYKEVQTVLKVYFKLEKSYNILGMTGVQKWVNA